MRRTALLLVLLVAALGVAAAGCGGEEQQSATPETVEGQVTTTTTETQTTESESTTTETTETTQTTETTTTETTPRSPGRSRRGQAGLPRLRGVRRLPHAGGRGLERKRRAEPRRREAELRQGPHAGDQRWRRHAAVQGHTDGAADRRRGGLRVVRRRQVARALHRLHLVIDLKAARSDPDAWRAALARKGAAEEFDALLEADERWRSLIPRVDELRGQTKLKGKPTPGGARSPPSRQGGAQGGRGGARRGRSSA